MLIYLNFTSYMHVTELLFSACTSGLYGQNCEKPCYDKCIGCNNVNGSCDRGCKPGWTGDNCKQRNVYYDLSYS